MKSAVKGLFLFVRAMTRWLFVDIAGEGYFKAHFTPSSRCRVVISPTDDPDDDYYDTRPAGEDMPGWLLPGYLIFAVVGAPLWIPLLVWELSVEKRQRFLEWIGDK